MCAYVVPDTANDQRPTASLRKRRQLDQVVSWHGLQGLSGLAPRRQSAHDHEGVEPMLPQEMRHPGAGRFARSSAIQKNQLVLGQVLDFVRQIVGLYAQRTANARGLGIVVAVAADINHQDVVLFF